jgi:hypothetical protein
MNKRKKRLLSIRQKLQYKIPVDSLGFYWLNNISTQEFLSILEEDNNLKFNNKEAKKILDDGGGITIPEWIIRTNSSQISLSGKCSKNVWIHYNMWLSPIFSYSILKKIR